MNYVRHWSRLPHGHLLLETRRPEAGRRTRIIIDSETGLPVIINEQDIRPILAANARARSDFDPWIARANNVGSSGMTRVASIPMVVWMKLRKLGITRDPVAFRKWLDRRDARLFRTDDGRRLS